MCSRTRVRAARPRSTFGNGPSRTVSNRCRRTARYASSGTRPVTLRKIDLTRLALRGAGVVPLPIEPAVVEPVGVQLLERLDVADAHGVEELGQYGAVAATAK